MAKNASESFRHERRPVESGRTIVTAFNPDATLSEASSERLKRLAELPDEEIDTSDIPELPPGTPYILNPYVPASARLKKAS